MFHIVSWFCWNLLLYVKYHGFRILYFSMMITNWCPVMKNGYLAVFQPLSHPSIPRCECFASSCLLMWLYKHLGSLISIYLPFSVYLELCLLTMYNSFSFFNLLVCFFLKFVVARHCIFLWSGHFLMPAVLGAELSFFHCPSVALSHSPK